MKNLFLPIILFLMLLSGCRKECNHDFLPDSIKPFLFKEGSYWVFANAATGGRDTFSVVKSTTEIFTGTSPIGCKGDPTAEIFDMTVVNGADTFVIQVPGRSYLLLSSKPYVVRGTILDASLSSGQCSKVDEHLCLTSISTMNINGNNFNEVYQLSTVLTDNNNAQVFCDLFWVKNAGLVKAVVQSPHATTLNIIEWHVVQ